VETRQVAQMFFMENLVVGGFAILLGTVLGNLIFQVLRAITLELFDVPYTFNFTFSMRAVLLTLLYFVLIYLFALLQSRKRISRMKIHDLIYFERQNESKLIKKGKNRRKTFVVSIILGIIGTVMLMLRNLTFGIVGAILIIVFLYGFFISFSSGVPGYFDKYPVKKYSGVTLIVFRSLSTKLATIGVIMATISLLFTATLLLENSSLFFHAIFQSRINETTVFDLFIGSSSESDKYFDEYLAYIDEKIPITRNYQYNIYEGDGRQIIDCIQSKMDFYDEYSYDTLISYSDYSELRKMLGYPTVELPDGEYIIHCMPFLEPILDNYTEDIAVNNIVLHPNRKLYTESFCQYMWNGNGYGYIIIVPDVVAAEQPISHRIYCAMTVTSMDETVYEGLTDIRDKQDYQYRVKNGYDAIYSKNVVRSEYASMYAILVYPMFYLALVLTMVAASILTIQLLSESRRYKRQYALLHNLGMEQREMERSFFRQFALFFAMPTVPPIMIAVPFTLALVGTTDPGVINGTAHIWSIIGLALGLFFTIYLVYICAAYISFKKSVLR
jgi:hypothetical protein